MKKLLLLISCVLSAIVAHAAVVGSLNPPVICETMANDSFAGEVIDMPGVRPIWSGSKIIVSYDEDVPQEMVGAFDFATKIWEEVLPPTLPITVRVELSKTMRGKSKISTVLPMKLQGVSTNYKDCSLPFTAIKAISMKDYNVNGRAALIDPRDLAVVSDSTDIVISYNPNVIEDFSFNLDAELEADKYDFVSLALRDIALGLGFAHQIRGSKITEKISYPPSRELTPYEKLLQNILGTDESMAYQKAMSDTLSVFGNKLYTPNPFETGKSLQYFVADESTTIGRLLRHDFSKGYIMRDITYPTVRSNGTVENGWDYFFKYAFEWVNDLFTGNGTGEIEEDIPEDKTLPFKGQVTFDLSDEAFSDYSLPENEEFSLSSLDDWEYDFGEDFDRAPIDPLPYSLRSPIIHEDLGTYYVISAQLKDGTWDNLETPLSDGKGYTFSYGEPTFTVDMDALTHSYPIDQYARTVDGGLKYRLVKRNGSVCYRQNFKVQYFTRSYTPQNAKIKYTKVYDGVQSANMESLSLDSEKYTVDVQIGISNLEGTTSVEVEQFDGDSEVPFYYDVDDFRKGYFVANLFSWVDTKLTLICYNENGYSESNTIIIPALGKKLNTISYKLNGESISIYGLNEINVANNNVRYSISTPLNSLSTQQGMINSERSINISSLPKGMYILSVMENGKMISSFKFAK